MRIIFKVRGGLHLVLQDRKEPIVGKSQRKKKQI